MKNKHSFSEKPDYNICPVCWKPRGKGRHEFSHGKCIEIRALTDGQKSAGLPGDLSRITVDQAAKARRKHRLRTDAQFNRWADSLTGGGDGYDFDAEHELVEQCQHGECIHMDCEQRRPPEIDHADH